VEFLRFETIAAAPPQKSKLPFFELFKERWKVPKTPDIEAKHTVFNTETSVQRVSDADPISGRKPLHNASTSAEDDGAAWADFSVERPATEPRRRPRTSPSGRPWLFVRRNTLYSQLLFLPFLFNEPIRNFHLFISSNQTKPNQRKPLKHVYD
jgi:hypothetical protein